MGRQGSWRGVAAVAGVRGGWLATFLQTQRAERQRDNTTNGYTWQTNAKNVDGLSRDKKKNK